MSAFHDVQEPWGDTISANLTVPTEIIRTGGTLTAEMAICAA